MPTLVIKRCQHCVVAFSDLLYFLFDCWYCLCSFICLHNLFILATFNNQVATYCHQNLLDVIWFFIVFFLTLAPKEVTVTASLQKDKVIITTVLLQGNHPHEDLAMTWCLSAPSLSVIATAILLAFRQPALSFTICNEHPDQLPRWRQRMFGCGEVLKRGFSKPRGHRCPFPLSNNFVVNCIFVVR